MAEKTQSAPRPGLSKDDLFDKDAIIMELQRQLEDEKEKNNNLEEQFKYRVGSFVKRENAARKTIEAMERQLSGCSNEDHKRRMGEIRNIHDSVMTAMENIPNNTAKILQEQEKDLMRAFRARLQDVSKELEAQRNEKGDHSAELHARYRRVVSELHASQELTQVFDKKNQQLEQEKQRLQERLRTRDDDRQTLLKELVLAKKDGSRIKQSIEERKQEEGRRVSVTEVVEDTVVRQSNYNRQYEREIKYRERITKFKRALECERQNIRAIRERNAKSDASRAEMETFLRQCLADVKQEIVRRTESTEDSESRARVLELLRSQQRVVELLYERTFPDRPSTPRMTPPVPEDLSWLDSMVDIE